MVDSIIRCTSALPSNDYKLCPFTRHVFLSGGVAVGKTTILNYIASVFFNVDDIFFVREYIDYDVEGEKRLESLHHGVIKNYQFQKYVLRCYRKQFMSYEFRNARIVIWERHLSEALSIFCENDESLTDEERKDIRKEIDELCEMYNIPSLNNINVKYIKINTAEVEMKWIAQMLLNGVIYPMLMKNYKHDLFVLLYCGNLKEQYRRVLQRGRSVELEVYKKSEDLLTINDTYFEFYLKHNELNN
ncbi:hypothetical protein EDI_089530 [Entamoeba dispar SAW760]|uniref:Deoxynucleoside kinase domain-containing protein n=1 Tax=Entamoeba dispar (strain ATCC PRA-260 / SAW760) TaxID=370354 RepID=B0EN57_ENTDS|nr:uncharacterized protein EDI_089530 [Entamoeba dispar SAW760]EDR24037.1 hypothetical protein EDI_089530 [Entamoeba dispar SAW760]|eukprot:EDR24037.1 hypothetical protein EDI_089530 [Entamoeba dispar SAW760]